MNYTISIYRDEVRTANPTLDFLEEDHRIPAFSDTQRATLQRRLAHYKYTVVSLSDTLTEYERREGNWSTSAYLSNNTLTFSCHAGNQDALFEVLMTASELCDGGDLCILNLQEGTWEANGETYPIE